MKQKETNGVGTEDFHSALDYKKIVMKIQYIIVQFFKLLL